MKFELITVVGGQPDMPDPRVAAVPPGAVVETPRGLPGLGQPPFSVGLTLEGTAGRTIVVQMWAIDEVNRVLFYALGTPFTVTVGIVTAAPIIPGSVYFQLSSAPVDDATFKIGYALLMPDVIGPQGPPGPTGPTGPSGSGTAGAGPIGPPGLDGRDGVDGQDGAAGATGPQGAAGTPGTPGASGAAGAVGPSGLDGVDGATGADGQDGSIGPTGPQGIQGVAGATGPTGPIGTPGLDGEPGVDGQDGAPGAVGAAGAAGSAGSAGPTGAQGPPGTDGLDGRDGADGDVGPMPALASRSQLLQGTLTNVAATPDAVAAHWEKGADNAGAGTITLGDGFEFDLITSSTTITALAFTVDKAGRMALLRATVARAVTHNATSLISPTGASLSLGVGDLLWAMSLGGGNFRIITVLRSDAVFAVSGVAVLTTSPTANGTTTNLSATDAAFTIAANQARVGSMWRLSAYFVFVHTAAATPTLTAEILINGAVVATAILTPQATASTFSGLITGLVTIRTTGAGGTCQPSLRIDSNAVGAANNDGSTATGTTAIDTTVTRTLQLQVRMTTAVVSNTLTLTNGLIEKVF